MSQELHAPGQLGEKVLGPADAKVTVVEYASMSCPHCAHFDVTTFDDFKLKYIDSGKVRYIFREFPLNAPAYAVAMVARCAPADKFFDVVHAYFRSQDKWLAASDVKAAILEIAKGFGFTDQSFDACLANQALFKALNDVRDRGAASGCRPRRPSSSTARSSKGRSRLRNWTRRSRRCSSGFDAPARAPASEACAHEGQPAPPARVQVLRRRHRHPDPAGRHRHRRPERLRQIQSRRGAPLRHGRKLLQGDARRRHGGRDLLRLRRPSVAQHGGGDAVRRARRGRGAGAPSRSRSRAGSSASSDRATASTGARCAPATCRSSSPTPRPARIPRRSSARARWRS